jgi:hypothetical protein
MLDLRIERVENGYTIREGVEGPETNNPIHVAFLQKDIGGLVVKLCRGAFGTEGGTSLEEEAPFYAGTNKLEKDEES